MVRSPASRAFQPASGRLLRLIGSGRFHTVEGFGVGVKIALIVVGSVLATLLLVAACGTAVILVSDGGAPTEDAGDDYCSDEKQRELASLQDNEGETINSPRLFRRATARLLRITKDAPRGAWCVENELENYITLWNSQGGQRGWGDAEEQVKRLRARQRR